MTVLRSCLLVIVSSGLVAGIACPASAVTHVSAPKKVAAAVPVGQAPADEYFGPLAMSILGIQNALKQTIRHAGADGVDRVDRVATVRLIEVAIKAWEKKYPHDSWLPKNVLALHHAYAQLADTLGADRAGAVRTWLFARYPKSEEARALRSAPPSDPAPASDPEPPEPVAVAVAAD